MASSVLQCINPVCSKKYNILEIRYACDCGELLEVVHDFEFHSWKEWREIFGRNLNGPAFLRFKDILLSCLPQEEIVSLGEGNTPLYPATKALQDYVGVKHLFLKHEGLNPTLSFKDRGMVAGVSWACHLGMTMVGCASTGDTSASLSAYAARAGLKCVVLLPKDKITLEHISQAIASGAWVLASDTDFDGCMKLIDELVARHPDIYLLNSKNPFRIEGQKVIGIETLHQLSWEVVPDWFIVPVGNAGNISALGKGMRELYELGVITCLPRLAGIQVEAANPLYRYYKSGYSRYKPVVAKETVASAIRIGSPISWKKAAREVRNSGGVFEEVRDEETMEAKAITDASGISICPNSAVAVAGAKKLREAGVIGKKDLVVIILTAHGAKFSKATIDYHEEPTSKYRNRPINLPADLGAVENALGLKN